MKMVTINELKQLNRPIIIDVREPDEYELGKIPNAINIPLDEMLDNHEKYLSQDRKYYIYCETSLRSSRACDFLSDFGYDVYLIDGGFKAWVKENGQKQ
ncbi:MAG TPA: rhodanese-like domain-containing protein [Mollicutes bacterium]|nr:rhodanese-like domain-containing protein [Mollicutes bacterium]